MREIFHTQTHEYLNGGTLFHVGLNGSPKDGSVKVLNALEKASMPHIHFVDRHFWGIEAVYRPPLVRDSARNVSTRPSSSKHILQPYAIFEPYISNPRIIPLSHCMRQLNLSIILHPCYAGSLEQKTSLLVSDWQLQPPFD